SRNYQSSIMLRLSLILVGFLPLALGFSNGGPASATCGDLLPRHGVDAQTGASPFGITPPGNTVQRGSNVELTLHGNGATFKGFCVRAFEGTDGSAGVFQASPNVQTRTCVGITNGATHTSPSLKEHVALSWTAPNYPTTVEFRSSVVVEFSTFHLISPVIVQVV
ncbi:unnamed protein product, partial [Meganyctiphanes norvegica]